MKHRSLFYDNGVANKN